MFGWFKTANAFQSTLPARGATEVTEVDMKIILISIHAPRTGSDLRRLFCGIKSFPFQSTLPARGATFNLQVTQIHSKFQSTLPARGATTLYRYLMHAYIISIHAPRTGSD